MKTEQDIDEEVVRHVAELARIELEEGDIEGFVEDFSEILEYFSVLDDLPEDIDKEDALENIWREDKVKESLDQDEVLGNAEESEDGYIKGPSVSE